MECTIPLKSVLNKLETYMTNEEILCVFNIGMRETTLQNKYLFVLQNICNQYIQEDKIVENISVFELLMTEIASYLGNRKEYTKSDEIALQVLLLSFISDWKIIENLNWIISFICSRSNIFS